MNNIRIIEIIKKKVSYLPHAIKKNKLQMVKET